MSGNIAFFKKFPFFAHDIWSKAAISTFIILSCVRTRVLWGLIIKIFVIKAEKTGKTPQKFKKKQVNWMFLPNLDQQRCIRIFKPFIFQKHIEWDLPGWYPVDRSSVTVYSIRTYSHIHTFIQPISKNTGILILEPWNILVAWL